MAKISGLYSKLSIIVLGIVIGIGGTYLLDKHREKQTANYVHTLFASMKDTDNSTNNWQNSKVLKNLGNKNISTIQSLGQLENYAITSTDTSYNFNNELGLHTVALVTTKASYKEGNIEIIFNLLKDNGQWQVNKVYINKDKTQSRV